MHGAFGKLYRADLDGPIGEVDALLLLGAAESKVGHHGAEAGEPDIVSILDGR